MTRTFVAIPLPPERVAKLVALQDQLAAEAPTARWVAPDQCHLTLAFLGDVPDSDLDSVCRAVGSAAEGIEPFDLRLEGLGAFPNPARPRTLWVAVTGPGLDPLHRLRAALVKALTAAKYPPADDRFTPHVTLGRLKERRGPAPDLSRTIAHQKGWTAGSWTVREVVAYASTLTPEGPEYTRLTTVALAPDKPPGSA